MWLERSIITVKFSDELFRGSVCGFKLRCFMRVIRSAVVIFFIHIS